MSGSFNFPFNFHDGKFDVVIVQGPRSRLWPSVGVRALSMLCAEMGLSVGAFGGDTIQVKGVLPLPGAGGLVLAQDVQNRVHRIQARAIVRFSAENELPDPFPGWRSQGLVPLSTAEKFEPPTIAFWEPATAILGTGNKALRFGSSLLEQGAPEIYCVETFAQWGAKRFAGWEVERRRFEMLGGRIIEATPVSLSPKSALVWEFRLKDAQGVRILDVARVVSAGPFHEVAGIREYPPGSLLFEIQQTSSKTPDEDAEGWALEEERGRYVAARIARALVTDLGPKKEDLDHVYRRARSRLKRYLKHRENPFTPSYQGKWISPADSKVMRSYAGVPQKEHLRRSVASLECFEEIHCTICEAACPEDAIRAGSPIVIDEQKCTGCGICVSSCPSNAIVMLRQKDEAPMSEIAISWRGQGEWKPSEFATLVNRRGDSLGTARVLSASAGVNEDLVSIETPTHLLWEARGIKRGRNRATEDEDYQSALVSSRASEGKVEITLNGERRLVTEGKSVSHALFETGRARAADALLCEDGSCGMCRLLVDGVNKVACQTEIHRGMAVKFLTTNDEPSEEPVLCPCLGITREQVLDRLKQGKLQSPEAVLSALHIGEGKCHGQLCIESFRRLLNDQASGANFDADLAARGGAPGAQSAASPRMDASQWIDWRFPWADWILSRS